ncbi:MAG TPA: 6,7-dimethyl-8-ribityllumazine synthase [Hanamia sp.]
MAIVNENLYNIDTGILQKDACIVIVHTQWNPEIVNKLLDGCIKILQHFEMNNYKILEVPGAFEIPYAIKFFWETYNKNPAFRPVEKPKAFIALGCVLRGGTPHFDYVCKAITEGVLHLNLTLPVPTIFGVLTVDDQQQADERTGGVHGNKGEEAALSALKMITLKYPNH